MDVMDMDVVDSLPLRTFCRIAGTTRLRGAKMVIVGLPPEVAVAMVRRGFRRGDVTTIPAVEEPLAGLDRRRRRRGARP